MNRETSVVLASMDLTLSDALHMLLTRAAQHLDHRLSNRLKNTIESQADQQMR